MKELRKAAGTTPPAGQTRLIVRFDNENDLVHIRASHGARPPHRAVADAGDRAGLRPSGTKQSRRCPQVSALPERQAAR
jgi:hypothetical protein